MSRGRNGIRFVHELLRGACQIADYFIAHLFGVLTQQAGNLGVHRGIRIYEGRGVVKAVETISADEVKIRLRNGSAQTVRVRGLTEGTLAVILEEAGETEKLSTDEKETSL